MKIIACIPSWKPHKKYLPTLIKHLNKHGFNDIVICGSHSYEDYPFIDCPDEYFQMYKRYLMIQYCMKHYDENDCIWFIDEDDCPLLYRQDISEVENTVFQYFAIDSNLHYAANLSNFVIPVKYLNSIFNYLLNNFITIEDVKITSAMEDGVIIRTLCKLYRDNMNVIIKHSFMHIVSRSSWKVDTCSLRNIFRNFIKMNMLSIELLRVFNSPMDDISMNLYNYYLKFLIKLSEQEKTKDIQECFDKIIASIYINLYLYKNVNFPEYSLSETKQIICDKCVTWLEHDFPNSSKEDIVSLLNRFEFNIPDDITEYINIFNSWRMNNKAYE